MPSQGPLFVGLGTNVAGGDTPWNNPNNISIAGISEASPSGFPIVTTDFLYGTHFGFSIPLDAAITAILIEIDRRSPNVNGISDLSVKALKAGVPVGSELAVAGAWPGVATFQSYGGNLLGTTWTAAQINDPNFGAYMQAQDLQLFTEHAQVSGMRITVSYTRSPFIGVIETDA